MQTNVAHHELSEQMLARFEEVCNEYGNTSYFESTEQSIIHRCKCGCMHVEHFLVEKDPGAKKMAHYERHYVELCDKHRINIKKGGEKQ